MRRWSGAAVESENRVPHCWRVRIVAGGVDRPGKSGGYYVCELLLILPGSSAL